MAKIGLFWVIAKSKSEIAKGNFKLISSANSSGINKYNNTIQTWQELVKDKPQLKDYSFWHFPRGRVEIIKTSDKTSYRLILNKAIATPTVIEQVRVDFNLNEHIDIRKDSTGEYDCIFDQSDEEVRESLCLDD